jgi:hypothetical protein
MTHPDEVRGADCGISAQERLRAKLLNSGLYDWVPLIEVETKITLCNLAETLPAQQDLALQTIRSLLEDGLMQIGELPGPDDEEFPAWDLSIDAAMERLYDRFVRHYDDPELWEFCIWLGITESGRQVAETFESGGAGD